MGNEDGDFRPVWVDGCTGYSRDDKGQPAVSAQAGPDSRAGPDPQPALIWNLLGKGEETEDPWKLKSSFWQRHKDQRELQ